MTVCKSKIFSLESSSGTSLEDKWNKVALLCQNRQICNDQCSFIHEKIRSLKNFFKLFLWSPLTINLVIDTVTAEAGQSAFNRDSWLDLPSLLVIGHRTSMVHFQENYSLRESQGEFRSSLVISRETIYQNIWFLTYIQKN